MDVGFADVIAASEALGLALLLWLGYRINQRCRKECVWWSHVDGFVTQRHVARRSTPSSNLGLGLFSAALVGLFAVALTMVLASLRGRHASLSLVAASTAAAGFVSVAVVPFLAYPANPPGVGLAETAGERTLTYLIVLAASLAAAATALAAAPSRPGSRPIARSMACASSSCRSA